MSNIGPTWKKSSRSSSNGNCVEARHHGGRVQLRDSKDPAGPALSFSPSTWRAFMDGTKDAQFDLR